MLIDKYQQVRQYTKSLCVPLLVEDFSLQRAAFVSPTKWHLAHTTWFFEQFILKIYKSDYQEYHSEFSYLFNSYYNAVGTRIRRQDRGLMSRPSVEQIYAYRAYVDAHMLTLLDGQNYVVDLIREHTLLGLNHEQQHQELLLTDLKYNFAINPLHPVYHPSYDRQQPENNHGFIDINEGLYNIGYQGAEFCYDNEQACHRIFVEQYQISTALVTNQDFIDFIIDGGYQNTRLWLDDGWAWLNECSISRPEYWLAQEGHWQVYSLAGLQALNPLAPVCHISFYEADAFARWKNMRLPTEFEWEIAAEHFNWGQRWEWTNSGYLPYPGFKITEGAIGEYNGKFMINNMVLRGCSEMTSEQHSRKTYRNFFHPQSRWQYTGLRLAKS